VIIPVAIVVVDVTAGSKVIVVVMPLDPWRNIVVVAGIVPIGAAVAVMTVRCSVPIPVAIPTVDGRSTEADVKARGVGAVGAGAHEHHGSQNGGWNK
jgi:hypothetical protein